MSGKDFFIHVGKQKEAYTEIGHGAPMLKAIQRGEHLDMYSRATVAPSACCPFLQPETKKINNVLFRPGDLRHARKLTFRLVIGASTSPGHWSIRKEEEKGN